MLSTSNGALMTPHAQTLCTLEHFMIERQGEAPHVTPKLTRLLLDISETSKFINHVVNRAGLVDVLGASGGVNIHLEEQQKLDVLAHQAFEQMLKQGGICGLMGSEEHDKAIPIKTAGKYIVLLDPVDGSSNIDVNVAIGTIFSIYLPEGADEPTEAHALQPGTAQLAAGYVVYGSSTILVYTTGCGVNGFTLDPSSDEFMLSHPNIQTPKTGQIYSINEGNSNSWNPRLKGYIKWMQKKDKASKRPYKARYIGSFVADFHRNLLKGGIFVYPTTANHPNGKLRLMYEANPMAFIVEQAGGRASDGRERILEKQPANLHECTPIYIGSEKMVRHAEAFLCLELDIELA